MRASLAVVALAGCNQAFALDQTHIVDAFTRHDFQTGLGCWVPDTIQNWNLAATPGEVTTMSAGTATLTLQLAVTNATIEVGLQPPAQLTSIGDALRIGASEQTTGFDCRVATGSDPAGFYTDPGGTFAAIEFSAGYHRMRMHVDATGATCSFDAAISTAMTATTGMIDTVDLYTNMTDIAFAYAVIYQSP